MNATELRHNAAHDIIKGTERMLTIVSQQWHWTQWDYRCNIGYVDEVANHFRTKGYEVAITKKHFGDGLNKDECFLSIAW